MFLVMSENVGKVNFGEKKIGTPNITHTHEGVNMTYNMTEGESHLWKARIETDQKISEDLYVEP